MLQYCNFVISFSLLANLNIEVTFNCIIAKREKSVNKCDLVTNLTNRALKFTGTKCPHTGTYTSTPSNLKLSSLEADTLELSRNTAIEINKQLKKLYGIDSKLTDPSLAQTMLSVVEDFCRVNKKDNLFRGLKLGSTNRLGSKDVARREYDVANGRFKIEFNKFFDWKHLDEITKQFYDAGKIPDDNPKCLLYMELGRFLNFKYNPIAYNLTEYRYYTGQSEAIALRISQSVGLSDFNANYIAGKMCGQSYPKGLHQYFEDHSGNIDLRFPKPIPKKQMQGSVHKFKSIEDAQIYLFKNYGIKAQFINQKQADYFAAAVDDLCKMTGDKTCFQGLKIAKDKKPKDLTMQMSMHWDSCTGEASMTVNPAYNWKQDAKFTRYNFQNGFHPSDNPKAKYIHELSHWLDFKGNPKKFGEMQTEALDKIITSKISVYATANSAEFCAEYIVGRFSGIKYPKCVDEEFLKRWNGPKLNFPQ